MINKRVELKKLKKQFIELQKEYQKTENSEVYNYLLILETQIRKLKYGC